MKNPFKRPPDFIIGDPERPYMLRWYLIPRNNWFNIYLHKIVRDDDDRALHDHPWKFISIVLKGSYLERLSRKVAGESFVTMDAERQVERRRFRLAFRRADDAHRVTLPRDKTGQPVPCWTVIVTGPKIRNWGFHCPRGWVPWQEFVEPTNHGNIGKGCGEA